MIDRLLLGTALVLARMARITTGRLVKRHWHNPGAAAGALGHLKWAVRDLEEFRG